MTRGHWLIVAAGAALIGFGWSIVETGLDDMVSAPLPSRAGASFKLVVSDLRSGGALYEKEIGKVMPGDRWSTGALDIGYPVFVTVEVL